MLRIASVVVFCHTRPAGWLGHCVEIVPRGGRQRWAWIQIAPLASAGDAQTALRGIGDRGLANLGARVRLVSLWGF